MKKSEWSDKQLEELLRQMPKIQDHRDPRDIYQNLSLKKRIVKTWLFPGISVAAVLLLVLILIPKLIDGTQFSNDQVSEKNLSSSSEMDLGVENKDTAKIMKKSDSMAKSVEQPGVTKFSLMRADSPKTAVYKSDVGNGKVLTYWIPDSQGQVLIPVSTIVNNAGDKKWITLFNENMAELTEEQWGLTEFYPVNATLTLNNKNNSVNVDVPENHPYGQGSTNEAIFVNALKKDILTNSNVKVVELSTNGHPGINFGNYGKVRHLNIQREKNRAYFLYIPERKNKPFLVPSKANYKDIMTAIKAMKTDHSEIGLKASLIQSIQIKDAFIKGKTLFIILTNKSRLKDNPNSVYSLEALLLTAKDFGAGGVVFTNAPIKQIGSFDLSKEIKVPLAPNLRNKQ